MGVGDPSGDRQSQPGSAGVLARRVESDESLEDALPVGHRHTGTGVFDSYLDRRVRRTQGHLYPSARRRVSDRVLQQVHRELANEPVIHAHDEALLEVRLEGYALRGGEDTQRVDAFLQDRIDARV
jgi:hypothetical protein